MTTPELSVAERAADVGGEILMRYVREGVAVRSKDVANLVSDADVESERVIVEAIRRAFPDHAVLGEESHEAGDVDAEHLWIVDPLDGTNNYAHAIPHFAVSIAYYRDGRPECSVVLNPATGDRYVAVRGGGATHNGRPIAVAREQARLDQALVGVGFYYDRGAMMEATLAAVGDLFRRKIHGIRRFGTAALDLCTVASGRFGAFFEYHLAPWDFAAGRLVVEEAGGRVTDCLGEPVPIAPSSLVASNGPLHEAVLEVVGPHLPRPGAGPS